MMSTDTSPWPQKDAGTRTHSPAYLNEEILASDGVLRDRGHLLGRGAVHGVDHLDERFEAGFGLVAILSEGEAARYRSLLRPGELWVQTDATPAIWAAGCHFSTQLARPHAAGGGKQVLRPPPLKIASTAEHVRRVVTRAREGHGGMALSGRKLTSPSQSNNCACDARAAPKSACDGKMRW